MEASLKENFEKFEQRRGINASVNIARMLRELLVEIEILEDGIQRTISRLNRRHMQKPPGDFKVLLRADKNHDRCLGPSKIRVWPAGYKLAKSAAKDFYKPDYQSEARHLIQTLKTDDKIRLHLRSKLKQVLELLLKEIPEVRKLHESQVLLLTKSTRFKLEDSKAARHAFFIALSEQIQVSMLELFKVEEGIDGLAKGFANTQIRRNGMLVFHWEPVKCDLIRLSGPHLRSVRFKEGKARLFRKKNKQGKPIVTRTMIRQHYQPNVDRLYALAKEIEIKREQRKQFLATYRLVRQTLNTK